MPTTRGFQDGCLNSSDHFALPPSRKEEKGPAQSLRRFSSIGLHNMSGYISLVRTYLNGPLATGPHVSLNKFEVLLLNRKKMSVQSYQEFSAKERINSKCFIFSSSLWPSSSLYTTRHNQGSQRREVSMGLCRKL